MIRSFVAVELSAEVKDAIRRVEAQLQARGNVRAVKWVDPLQMHVTLKFLGDVPQPHIGEIQAALDRVAAAHAPFELALAGLGTFPGGTRVRVVWIGVERGAEPLVALTDAVEQALNAMGFKPERHEPSPHVTLGRVRDWAGAEDRRVLGDLVRATAVPVLPAQAVDHISLMQSHLSPQGAHYQQLASCPLGSGKS